MVTVFCYLFSDPDGPSERHPDPEREPQFDRGHPEENVPQVVRAPHHRLLVQQLVRD